MSHRACKVIKFYEWQSNAELKGPLVPNKSLGIECESRRTIRSRNMAGAHHYIDPRSKTRRWRPCLDRDDRRCSAGGHCRISSLLLNNRDRMRTMRSKLTICRQPLHTTGRSWKSRLNCDYLICEMAKEWIHLYRVSRSGRTFERA